MNIEELIPLFPLKGKLTQEIIDRSEMMDPWNCFGTNTLKAALAPLINIPEDSISWVSTSGRYRNGSHAICIGTQEDVYFADTDIKPQEVTFIILKYF